MSSHAPGSSIDAARKTLQTLESSDPTCLRRQALDAIRRLAGAEEAVFFRYAHVDGRRFYASPVTTSPEADAVYLRFDGVAVFETHPFDHLRPRPLERSRFVDQRRLVRLPLPPDNPIQRHVYGPLGVLDEQRALCFDGRRFIGHVSTHFRAAGRVSPPSTAALNQLMPAIHAVLVRADRVERAELDPPPYFCVRANGHIAAMTPGGERWLTRSRRERIADIVRQADRASIFEPIHLIERARATLVRMYGAEVMYLFALEATTAPELSPDHLLTPRQRQIAAYAVAGATAREIAETLSLSMDTVRDHLKAIYGRLEVASRVELARALAVPDGASSP